METARVMQDIPALVERLQLAGRLLGAEGDTALAIGEEMKELIRAHIDEEELEAVEAVFAQLDLSTKKDRWSLGCSVMGPIRIVLMHDLFKAYVVHQATVLGKYTGTTLTELFKSLTGRLDVVDNPASFLDDMLASIREQFKSQETEVVVKAMDEFVDAITKRTLDEITVHIDHLELEMRMRTPQTSTLQRLVPEVMEQLGLPQKLVDIMRQRHAVCLAVIPGGIEAFHEKKDTKQNAAKVPLDDLTARSRIQVAILSSQLEDADMRMWGAHPEQLSVTTPEGEIPLLQSMLAVDPLSTDQIVGLIDTDKVTYTEQRRCPTG